MPSKPSFPSSYNGFTLPTLRFSHHPSASAVVTPVVQLILDRMGSRNAFNDDMTSSLVQAFDLLSADPRVKVIVLASADPANRTFCAGMDLTASFTFTRSG